MLMIDSQKQKVVRTCMENRKEPIQRCVLARKIIREVKQHLRTDHDIWPKLDIKECLHTQK